MFDLIKFLVGPEIENQRRIADWARLNGVNPFDMGQKNYQRCRLYDLGLGGVKHELEYDGQGKLKYH